MDIDNGSVALEITPSPSSPAPAYSLASGEQHPAAAVNAPTTDQIIEVVAEVIEEAVEVIAEGKKHTFRRKKPKNATKKGGLQPVPFSVKS